MMQFKRGGDIQEKLGIGEFAPMVAKIKESLTDIIVNRATFWSTDPEEMKKPIDKVDWKSIPGKKDDNMNRIIGSAYSYRYVTLKDHIRNSKYSIKGVFESHDCKLTDINIYHDKKWFDKFGVDHKPSHLLIEIIYSKNKKR